MTAPNPDVSGAKPRVIRYERKRQALLGNQRALKHGRYSPRIKAERLAERRAQEAEDRERFEAWSEPILARCRLQHLRVLAELQRERQEREAAEAQRAAHLKKVIRSPAKW